MVAAGRSTPGGVVAADLEAVIAAFRGLGGALEVAIEDADGTRLVGTSSDPAPSAAAARVVAAGRHAGLRIRTWGAASSELSSAVAEGLAAALAGHAPVDPAAAGRDVANARRMAIELAHARQLQRSFVSLVPPPVPGYEIAAHYEAAREVGGDFFEIFRLRKRGRPLSIVIADVTGKGIAAALLMAFSRPLLHAAIDNTTDPAEALIRTNRILVEERRSSLFITALVARLDVTTGQLSVANAGHEPPLLVRGDGSPVASLEGSGPLIGAFGDLALPTVDAVLAPGDLVLLYTDGVTDARSPDGERFDEWRLLEAVQSARDGGAAEVVGAVADAVGHFQGCDEVADDITIVAVRRTT